MVYKKFQKVLLSKAKTAFSIEKQQRVFLTCFLLTAVFVVCWLPYTIKVLYEFITGTKAAIIFTDIAGLAASMNPVGTSFIMIKFDNRISANVRSMMKRLFPQFYSQEGTSIPINSQAMNTGEMVSKMESSEIEVHVAKEMTKTEIMY